MLDITWSRFDLQVKPVISLHRWTDSFLAQNYPVFLPQFRVLTIENHIVCSFESFSIELKRSGAPAQGLRVLSFSEDTHALISEGHLFPFLSFLCSFPCHYKISWFIKKSMSAKIGKVHRTTLTTILVKCCSERICKFNTKPELVISRRWMSHWWL